MRFHGEGVGGLKRGSLLRRSLSTLMSLVGCSSTNSGSVAFLPLVSYDDIVRIGLFVEK